MKNACHGWIEFSAEGAEDWIQPQQEGWRHEEQTGIVVCGLNGVGKSTLGRVLAERLGFWFIDNGYVEWLHF